MLALRVHASADIAARCRGSPALASGSSSSPTAAETLELPQSVVPALARDGIAVWVDGNFGAAHNKVMVIDADGPHATTITGSYNFTLAAQKRNAENVVMFRDNPEVARAYRAYFRRLQVEGAALDRAMACPATTKPRVAR